MIFVELGWGMRPPGALDLAGFNFHVPLNGSSAAIAAVATTKAKSTVAAITIDRLFMRLPFN
jgi:hypothetical protein